VIVASYPIIITDELHECRDFYRVWFGFEVVFEADWIVVLSSAGTDAPTLAFMHSDHPSSPPSPAPYEGDGTFLTLQVEDASAEYERLRAAGLECALELTDEPWGQRRFAATDPAGMWVDVVEQIEPAAGWWDRYLQPSDRHQGPLP
jgi:catechol 2,3-dioxygenase-like lactoylglutathione lyase family enzyme